MSQTQQTGQAAELFVCHYLQEQGLCLIQRNYCCRFGEIDLIMRDVQDLVFIEVRYRAQIKFGDGLDSVCFAKQRRLIRSAEYYLQKHVGLSQAPCRFDVVAVTSQLHRSHVQWVKHAFQSY